MAPSVPIDSAGTRPADSGPPPSAARSRRSRRRWRALLLAGGHLFVLSAFAFAQPLFDLLAHNAEFFAVRGSTREDIVAFVLGALLVPPTVLLLVELVATAGGVLVWRAVHLVFVAALSAAIVLHALAQRVDGGTLLLVGAAVVGGVVAWLYVRTRAVRTFLTVLIPAPVILTLLFLFDSPVNKLLTVEEDVPAAVTTVSKTRDPVVVVVFDELTTVSLLNARGRIDAGRYPNFARLARDATFYRQATTVHGWTEHAVPAILTGRIPRDEELPIYADHRQNLFTLLGRTYRIRAHESITSLCPKGLCERGKEEPVEDEPVTSEPASAPVVDDSFASDVSILYLHTLLPSSLAERLPAIDQSWRNFRGGGGGVSRTEGGGAPAVEPPCAPVCRLTRDLDSARPGTLYFFHAPIPHPPWRYLPSGKTYLGDTQAFPGLVNSVWQDDDALIRQAYARYMLQVGFTDRALGMFLDRLKRRRLYDRSLIVVVADHGVNLQPGTPRRQPSAEGLDEVAFVPLFVKLPRQRRGRVQDGLARTVDVLPTIADALHIPLRWDVDGRSLLDRAPPADGTVEVMRDDGGLVSAPLSELVAARGERLRQQIETFGSGGWDTMWAGGPLASFVGRRVEEVAPTTAAGLELELDGRTLLNEVDPSSHLTPSYLAGRIEGAEPGWDLALAVGGRIVATSRTYDALGEVRFAGLVPESSLRAGRNEIAVVVARPGSGGLERIEERNAALRLTGAGLRRADGTTVPLDDDIRGEVAVATEPGRVDFSGWAADLAQRSQADSIAVFVDGRLLYEATGISFRRDRPPEEQGIEGVGFGFPLPDGALPARGDAHDVRVIALSDGRAGELDYASGYPWRTSG